MGVKPMKKYTYHEVVLFVREKTNCELLTKENEFINSTTNLNLKCSCGHTFSKTFSQIRTLVKSNKEIRCKDCLHKYQSKKFKLTNEEAYNVLLSKLPSDFKIVDFEYTGKYGEVYLQHECGEIIKNSFHYFRNQKIVCKCQKPNNKKSRDEIEEYLIKLRHDDYEVCSYANSKEITLRHKTCGTIFERTFDNIRVNGVKCPSCFNNESTGVKKIITFLTENNIDYIKEYSFKDCRDINTLPFDFYIPKYKLCIEYDGIQHFEPVDFFGGESKFKITVIHDEIKNKYCKENGIHLLRIPYYDLDNIYNIMLNTVNMLIPR